MNNKFMNDGGYASRKFWFSVFAVGAILLAGKILGVVVVPEVVMGIVMVTSIYVAGNAIVKWRNASFVKNESDPQSEADPEDPKKDSDVK